MNNRNRTALITGASAGIGAEFARQLAGAGANLILTARRGDRLDALADELRKHHGVLVWTLCADLSEREQVTRLISEITALGVAVDIFINNAGYGLPGRFHSADIEAHRHFMAVMMDSPLALIHALLPGMRARGYGRILNVASLAGFMPGSDGHTLYGASKAFWIKVSESLSLENQSKGVLVLALCPGFTYSEFHDANGARSLVKQLPKFLWMDADAVVREGLAALEADRIVHVAGRINRLVKAFVTSLPDGLARAFSKRQSRRFRIAHD